MSAREDTAMTAWKGHPMPRLLSRLAAGALGGLLLVAAGGRPEVVVGDAGSRAVDQTGGRVAAVQALAARAAIDGERVVPALADALVDPSPAVRRHAAEGLLAAAHADLEGAAAVERLTPQLVARLEDPDAEVRAVAAAVLASASPHTSPRAADALVARLDDPAREVRENALGALAGLRSPGEPVIGALLVTLRDDAAPSVRGEAARALGALRPRDAAVVEGLIAALGDADPYVRRQAVRALGKLGAGALAAAGELERIADDPTVEAETRMHAVYALRSILGPAVE